VFFFFFIKKYKNSLIIILKIYLFCIFTFVFLTKYIFRNYSKNNFFVFYKAKNTICLYLKIKKKTEYPCGKKSKEHLSAHKKKKFKIKVLLQDVETELENTKLHPRRSCYTKMKP
jgi:hypothetical protein